MVSVAREVVLVGALLVAMRSLWLIALVLYKRNRVKKLHASVNTLVEEQHYWVRLYKELDCKSEVERKLWLSDLRSSLDR